MTDTHTSRVDVDMGPKGQGKADPARYEAAAEVTMRNNKNVSFSQTFLFILSVVFTDLARND
jgi:hypothetical protein